MFELIGEILFEVIEYAIKGFEIVGVVVILISGIRGLICYIRRDAHTQEVLFKGLSMGLSFALGGEILHTFVARELRDVVLVGGIIVLRVALTVLMHWEMKEHKHAEEKHEKENGNHGQQTHQRRRKKPMNKPQNTNNSPKNK